LRGEEKERSLHKSPLIEGGKKMSFADLQFKLSTMEVSLFKELTEERKKIVKEENKDSMHGTEAEMVQYFVCVWVGTCLFLFLVVNLIF
jgi:hypothetical protein